MLTRDDASALADQIDHLEDIPDIRALTSRLAADRRALSARERNTRGPLP